MTQKSALEQAIDLSMIRYKLCRDNNLPKEAQSHLNTADNYAKKLAKLTGFHGKRCIDRISAS